MSVLDIWNQALSAVKARGRLTSLSDRTPEGEVCSQIYPTVLEMVQCAAWWPACKALARLALLSESDEEWTEGDPEPGYAFAYALPEGMLHPWHFTDYTPFSLSYSSTRGRMLLSTNTQSPVLVYARKNEDPASWTQGQRQATIFALAAHIATPLTGSRAMVEQNFQLASRILEDEQARAANAIEPDSRPAVPWLAARGFSVSPRDRFIYPFGAVSVAGVAK